MCFSIKAPKIDTKPTPAPKPQDATKQAAGKVRQATAEQTGVTGNIFTTSLGDVGYGQNAQKAVKLGGQ